MSSPFELPSRAVIDSDVARALEEDVGACDLTAGLIPATATATARVIAREPAVICGQAWFDAVFTALDAAVRIDWRVAEGERVAPDQLLCTLRGNAQALLTGERAALNFLQLLSGTATVTRRYVDALGGRNTRLLDTRKTVPCLRRAQKYAVTVGGGSNHRMGLFDAFLIKENHISACGGIAAAVTEAHAQAPGRPVEVEVESHAELREALAAGADQIMLDNFDLDGLRAAVEETRGRAILEASGNVSLETLAAIAATGVDCISVGALTKHVTAVDLSMRLTVEG